MAAITDKSIDELMASYKGVAHEKLLRALSYEIRSRYRNAAELKALFKLNPERIALLGSWNASATRAAEGNALAYLLAGQGIRPATIEQLDGTALAWIKAYRDVKVKEQHLEWDEGAFIEGLIVWPGSVATPAAQLAIPAGIPAVRPIVGVTAKALEDPQSAKWLESLDAKQQLVVNAMISRMVQQRRHGVTFDVLLNYIGGENEDADLIPSAGGDDAVMDLSQLLSGLGVTNDDLKILTPANSKAAKAYGARLSAIYDAMGHPEGDQAFIKGLSSGYSVASYPKQRAS